MRLLLGALAMLALATTACAIAGPSVAPTESFCNGIGSDVGGCASDRPRFTGDSCESVAHEFGRQVNDRLLAISTGPESADESKAVRAGHYVSVAASLANSRIRALGLVEDCEAGAFLDAAESEFSTAFRDHAGELLSDGPPVTYDEWRMSTLAVLSILDREEG